VPVKEKIRKIFDLLYKHFGPQHWWPGETPFEIMVGAVLTQSTNWGNVEKAINNLKSAGFLDPGAIEEMSTDYLAHLIRPAGYFNQKAKKLKNLVHYLISSYQGDIERMRQEPLEKLRAELLSVRGIGKETADSILLYALEKPIFVVDTYTFRVLSRHRLIGEEAFYDEIQELFMNNLEPSVELFNEYHALFVAVCKTFCKKKKPLCDHCPLKPLLEP
jgi:endonuclease-3 related protein